MGGEPAWLVLLQWRPVWTTILSCLWVPGPRILAAIIDFVVVMLLKSGIFKGWSMLGFNHDWLADVITDPDAAGLLTAKQVTASFGVLSLQWLVGMVYYGMSMVYVSSHPSQSL